MQQILGILLILIHQSLCESKYVCITTQASVIGDCRDKILYRLAPRTVTESNLKVYIKENISDYTFHVVETIKFDLNLNIFNNKSVTLINYYDNNYLNISDIHNINLTILASNVFFNGTFNDNQSHLNLGYNNKCEIANSEAYLKSFSLLGQKIPFTKIYADYFYYKVNSGNIILNDDFIDVANEHVEFPNKNINIVIESINFTLISNITKNSYISTINASNVDKMEVYSDDNLNLIPLIFDNCHKVITNMTHVSNSRFELKENNSYYYEIEKDFIFDGNINLPKNTTLTITVPEIDNASRMPIKIDSLSVESESYLVIPSSWIDLTISSLTLNSKNIPISPCIGSGGASSTIINNVIYHENEMLPFDSLKIQLDVSGYQTQNSLETLLSKDWDMIIFKSFIEKVPVLAQIPNIIFDGDAYGFGGYWNIFNARSEITNDYIIKTNISSYLTIPLLIDYYSNTSLSEIIDPGQKMINLTLKGNDFLDIDLTGLKTVNAILTFGQNSKISSIKMNEYSDDQNIHQLIFNKCTLGNGIFQFNAKIINFTDLISIDSKYTPQISFASQSQVEWHSNKTVSLINKYDGIFPLTHIHVPVETDIRVYSDSISFGKIEIPTEKIPKFIINMNMTDFNKDELYASISINTAKINDITFTFNGLNTTKNITIDIYNEYPIEEAINFGIDFGDFRETNIIDLKQLPKENFFNFKGIIDEIKANYIQNSCFCACKDSSCDLCGPNVTIVSFEELDSKIKNYDETKQVNIYVTGTDNINIPLLSFDSIVNKDANIVGIGQNQKIKIDCTKRLDALSTFIKFSNITIIHTAGDNLAVSNLDINENCKIDASFKEVSIVTDICKFNLNHLLFKSVFCNSLLKLRKKVGNFNSNSKVSFGKGAKFIFTFPNIATIRGSTILFDNLEFNLENSIPICDNKGDTHIIGENGNLEKLYQDIHLDFNSEGSLKFSGTWDKLNYTKFFVIDNRNEWFNLTLDIGVIPLKFSTHKNVTISLMQKDISIYGALDLRSIEFCNISTPFTENVYLYVDYWYFEGESGPQVYYDTSNIHTIIKKVIVIDKKRSMIPYFNLNVDFDGYNTLKVLEKTYRYYDYSYVGIQYNAIGKIGCYPNININCYPNDPRLYDFFGKNITIMERNETEEEPSTYPYINSNLRTILKYDNFRFYDIDGVKTVLSIDNIIPYENGIKLVFGDCDNCYSYEIITEDDFENIYKFVPRNNSNVTISIYKSMQNLGYLDFDKNDITIPKLYIKTDRKEYIVNIKFGYSVKELEAFSAKLSLIESNYSIEKVTFSFEAEFLGYIDYNNILSMCIIFKHTPLTIMEEFKNELEIVVDVVTSTDYYIEFNSYGFDIVYDYYYLEKSSINVSKYPKLTLTILEDVPEIRVENKSTIIKYFDLLQFKNVETIYIGSGWENVNFTNKINVIDSTDPKINIKSLCFNSWDIMNYYPVEFNDCFKPFKIEENIMIDNHNITIYPNRYYSLGFNNLIMTGNSSINMLLFLDPIYINTLIVRKGISIADMIQPTMIEIEPAGTLKCNCDISKNLTQMNLYWDLDQPPIFESSLFQNLCKTQLNIIYNGSSIRKRKLLFDQFLANGTLIISNIDSNIIDNIHFISNNTKEFNDGEDLALECRLVDNDIYLFTTRQLYNESEVFETDSPSQSPSESLFATPIPSESIYPTFSPLPYEQITSEPNEIVTIEPLISVSPTQQPIINPPTVSTYESKNETIVLEENGYRDGDDFFEVEKKENEIALISSKQQNILLKANGNNNNQRNDLFVSPEIQEAVITISSPNEGKDDYGDEKYGIHANSNNPIIKLPQSNVPLSIYNNGGSEIELINENEAQSETISLDKLTIDKGELKINIEDGINSVEFEEVEAFDSSKIGVYNSNVPTETKIGTLKMNQNSFISLYNINFSKNIKAYSNTKIEVELEAKFSDQTSIELTDSSFIEFKQSKIEGICKEIKIVNSNLKNNAINLEDEKVAKLMCGTKFDCNSWSDKYQPNEFYKYPKCVQEYNENCLVVSNKNGNNNGNNTPNKKPLSGGAIAAIVIVVIVVVAAVVVGIIIWKKKSRKVESDVENSQNQNENGFDL